MTFNQPQTLKEIASIIGARFVGDEHFQVLGSNEIHMVRPGDIVFVNHPKYYDKALNSAATIILIDKEVECPAGKALLVSEEKRKVLTKPNPLRRVFLCPEETWQQFNTLRSCRFPSAPIRT